MSVPKIVPLQHLPAGAAQDTKPELDPGPCVDTIEHLAKSLSSLEVCPDKVAYAFGSYAYRQGENWTHGISDQLGVQRPV